jgi:hypothetical protein
MHTTHDGYEAKVGWGWAGELTVDLTLAVELMLAAWAISQL